MNSAAAAKQSAAIVVSGTSATISPWAANHATGSTTRRTGNRERQRGAAVLGETQPQPRYHERCTGEAGDAHG